MTHVRTAGAPYAVTVSVGAAAVTWSDPVGLQATADAAVYRAKHSGRDRVCVPLPASDGSRTAPLALSGR